MPEVITGIRLNHWVSPEHKSFCYKILWPFSEPLNPDDAAVDVELTRDFSEIFSANYSTPSYFADHLPDYFSEGERQIMLEAVREELEDAESNGQSYLPINRTIVVKHLSHTVIESSLEQLLEVGYFQETISA